MFPPTRTSTLAQRTLATLRLARSFLLLEDDYDVDWEVDREEPGQSVHPHRVALPGRMDGELLQPRRPGQPSAPLHVCISPVNAPAPTRTTARARLEQHECSHRRPDSAKLARDTTREA
jgi:hypothetical protein